MIFITAIEAILDGVRLRLLTATTKPELRVIGPSELSGDIVEAWFRLGERAVEANAYLSPNFVLPALHYLTPDAKIQIVLVECHAGDDYGLIGLGIFRECPADRHFPLPYLRAFKSRHSFLTGLLLDRHYGREALSMIFDYFLQCAGDWHAVEFNLRPGEGELDILMAEAAEKTRITWYEWERVRRAILLPAESGDSLLSSLSAKRQREIGRMYRRLAGHGNVTWEMRLNGRVSTATINRFLTIENLGWKGEKGTSLKSKPSDTEFFREMMAGFNAQNMAFFTELYVDDSLVASTSNLISGESGFAFKIGWDPEYAKMSPGLLNEIEFVKNVGRELSDLQYIDSGAADDSFINTIWPHRRTLTSGLYPISTSGKLTMATIQGLRRLKRTYGSAQ